MNNNHITMENRAQNVRGEPEIGAVGVRRSQVSCGRCQPAGLTSVRDRFNPLETKTAAPGTSRSAVGRVPRRGAGESAIQRLLAGKGNEWTVLFNQNEPHCVSHSKTCLLVLLPSLLFPPFLPFLGPPVWLSLGPN